MQIDRSWSQAYAPDPAQPQSQPPQQTPYLGQRNYDAVAPYENSSQDDTHAREAQLDVWSHGNKRVKLNDYGASTQDPALIGHLAQYPHHPHGTTTQADPTFAHPQTGFEYSHPAQPLYTGYQDYVPTGGLSQASGGMDQHASHMNVYQQTNTSTLRDAERTSGAGSSLASPVTHRQDGSYDGHGGHVSAYAPESQTQQYNSQPAQFCYGAPAYAASSMSSEAPIAPIVNYSLHSDYPDSRYPYGGGWAQSMAHMDNTSLYGKDVNLHLKLQSLQVLDNLSTQIIICLAKPSLSEIERLTSGEDSEEAQAYTTRKSLFDQTRKVYTRDSPFIDAVAIQLFTPPHQDIVRKANKATFISSILQSHDVSFFDLNEHFMEIFVPTGQRLLKWQGGIFLELKTQVYISALLNSDGSALPMLDELFPTDLEDRIIARHPDAPNLAPSEQDFIDRARLRKQYLQRESFDTALEVFPKKYDWQDFIKEFLVCISKNVEALMNPPNRSSTSYAVTQSPTDIMGRRNTLGPAFDDRTRNSVAGSGIEDRGHHFSSGHHGQGNHISMSGMLSDHAAGSSANAQSATAGADTTSPTASSKPAKASASGTPRQPWKQEEEDALMAGLEAVKGPHWSQILSLYGRGGSISEVLKDRNQIQLKDKARNLKLWHLKMGNEVPACLQGVTGELRKRGGARVRAALGLDGPDGAEAPGSGSGSSKKKGKGDDDEEPPSKRQRDDPTTGA